MDYPNNSSAICIEKRFHNDQKLNKNQSKYKNFKQDIEKIKKESF